MPKREAEFGVVLSTCVSPPDAARLRDLAANGDRSLAAELRRAVRSYLLNDNAPAGTGALPKTDVTASGDAP